MHAPSLWTDSLQPGAGTYGIADGGRYTCDAMFKLVTVYLRLGESLKHVTAAPDLAEEMADLTRHFRDAFRQSPDRFNSTTELQGFAPVRIEFEALCPTAWLVTVAPYTPGAVTPDAHCLLVNGLEDEHDIFVVKSKVKFPPVVWRELHQAEKPVAVVVFHVNGRMRDPATITILHVVANTYFSLFGTNEVAGESTNGV